MNENALKRYVASYLASKGNRTTHGINSCLAVSHAEAYGIIKKKISFIFKEHSIHISNITTVSSLMDETFDVQEFESQ